MKRIKVIVHKDGNFDTEAIEGFSQGTCHSEVEKLVTSIGGAVIKKEDKPDFTPENPDDVFINGAY